MRSRIFKFFLATTCMILVLLVFQTWEAEARDSEPRTYLFDFGAGPIEQGYTGVSCSAAYSPSIGYGWADASIMNGRDRDQSFDLLERDFCFANAYTFLVDLPNGLYKIQLISGDEIADQAAMDVYAEGELKLEGIGADAGQFIKEAFSVEIVDGQLELTLEGNTARINALMITPLFQFDFGPGEVQDSYTAVTCGQAYDPSLGYGLILSDELVGHDRNLDDALRSDFCEGDSFTFLVDLDNGSYEVSLMAGDQQNDTTLSVYAEGSEAVSEVTASAGGYIEKTFEAEVNDGQLTIAFIGEPARINSMEVNRILERGPAPWPVNEGVQLEETGSNVTLTNADISITINKSSPTISVLRKRGDYEHTNLLGGGRGYYHLNYVHETSRQYGGSNMSYNLISQSEDRVEISLSVDNPDVLPFRLDYRFVMEADSPGFYIYSIFDYHEGMPEGVEIEQSRYSFRGNPEVFDQYVIEDRSKGDRMGAFPSASDIRSGETLMDATYRFADGEIYTKYQHAVHIGDNDINGIFGEDIGLSIIRASDEYLVGGPAKQEYFVEMTNTTPMVHWYEQVRHYGVPNVAPEKGWSKIYGPFYVYVNEADGIEQLWADVKEVAADEKAKWPYKWLEDPLYEANTRGSVSGQLVITDGSIAEGAWVILGKPGLNFYEQNLDYLYYVKTDENGQFTIPHVREGEYQLFAYTDGVFGEFHYDGIVVEANQELELGVLNWTPDSYGETLWQIGTPDRTPREFKYGDELRQWGLWLQYPLDFPNGVDFVIGESDEQTDWNYFHPAVKTPGNPDHLLVPRDTTIEDWNIQFEADNVAGTGTLTIAIAGSSRGSLAVLLNGIEIASYSQLIPIGNDASVYRAGETGYYNELVIPFDASLLEQGNNIITLRPLGSGGSTDGVMYDALKLEVMAFNIETLQESVAKSASEGQLSMPLLAILENRLEQAHHHQQNDRLEQAGKHLQDFLKHLSQKSMQTYISDEARSVLEMQAETVLDALTK